MSDIDFEALNISQREAVHFRAPHPMDYETARKAWVAARLFDSWADIMTDGPDDSDKMMAQRFLEAGIKLSRELRPK
jgi:hypothetical protein